MQRVGASGGTGHGAARQQCRAAHVAPCMRQAISAKPRGGWLVIIGAGMQRHRRLGDRRNEAHCVGGRPILEQLVVMAQGLQGGVAGESSGVVGGWLWARHSQTQPARARHRLFVSRLQAAKQRPQRLTCCAATPPSCRKVVTVTASRQRPKTQCAERTDSVGGGDGRRIVGR